MCGFVVTTDVNNTIKQIKSLEEALEYIDESELGEITPQCIRMRKKLLTENERKKQKRIKTD